MITNVPEVGNVFRYDASQPHLTAQYTRWALVWVVAIFGNDIWYRTQYNRKTSQTSLDRFMSIVETV